MENFLSEVSHSNIIMIVAIAIVMDTIFGVGRAIKEKKFNSCFGIDGAIRKIAMIVSICFLYGIDKMVNINLIGFIPETIREYLNISDAGLSTFFAVLYIAYEVVSILKNMTLCGLPVKGIWKKVRGFLTKYTTELPDTEEIELENETTAKEEV